LNGYRQTFWLHDIAWVFQAIERWLSIDPKLLCMVGMRIFYLNDILTTQCHVTTYNCYCNSCQHTYTVLLYLQLNYAVFTIMCTYNYT